MMACVTYYAAPPYPTVVAVKLSTITGPNGVAGFCGRSGFSARARNPDGSPMEPTLIATTMAIGGVSRNARTPERTRTGVPSSSASRGAPSGSTEDWESTSSRTAMTGPLPGTTQHERQRHTDTADDSEDACAGVHHRV